MSWNLVANSIDLPKNFNFCTKKRQSWNFYEMLPFKLEHYWFFFPLSLHTTPTLSNSKDTRKKAVEKKQKRQILKHFMKHKFLSHFFCSFFAHNFCLLQLFELKMLTMGFFCVCVYVRRVEKRDFNTMKPLRNQMKCCALLSSLNFKLRKLNTRNWQWRYGVWDCHN